MPMRPARGSISRPTLIWLIVAGVLIASGIGVYFAIRAGSGSQPRQGPAVNLDPGVPQPPPTDMLDSGAFSGENGRAQFADKDDPSRLAGEMLYRRFDPLPRGRYQLEAPQLWLFLKDGRTVHVEAARGNVKLFTGTQKPESGRFEGGVVARIYATGIATPSNRPDPAVTRPELLAYSESLVFDLSLFEFTTDDVINLSTPDMEIQGEGLNVVVDEVRESLASVRLGAVGYIHVRDGGDKNRAERRDEKKPSATPARDATSPGVAAAPPPPPKIDLYAITITGPVALTVGTRQPQSITADTLLAWARLVDGKLTPNAIAELGAAATTQSPPAPTPPPIADATPAAPGQPSPAAPPAQASARGMRERLESLRVAGPSGILPLTPIADEDALLTWGGELVATAVEPAPPELEKEQVAVRFVSEGDTPVMLMDARSGATVLCRTAHYGATTADIALTPRDEGVITIADARQGFGELRGLSLNLKTGVGQSRGQGFFARRDPGAPGADPASPDDTQQRLAWSDQADFVFATDASSNAGIRAIRSAVFAGSVSGRTGEAEVTGDVLRAWFEPAAASDALLQRVVVEGDAVGRTTGDQEPQSLRAAKLDLSFSPDETGNESHPRLLLATGGVKGQRTELVEDTADPSKKTPQKSDLTCNELEADLARDPKGNVLVTAALARGDALFTRSDGIRAAGDEIRAGVAAKTADILGPAATVAARGASLSAPDLHLDSASNAVLAKGPGTLVHTDPDAARLEPGRSPALPPDLIGRTTLTWTKGMRYDNTRGEGEALGAVVAVTYPDPFTHNTVKGEQVKILTAPVTPPSGDAPAPATEESVLGDVRLLRAEAIAAPPDEQPGAAPAKATAEQRTYAADPSAPDGRRLEKLVYIEGPRLIADEQNGEFSIPAAGRALFLDHSIANRPENRSATGAFSSMGGRGTTLFEWSGAMILRRLTQLADVSGGVRITHKPLSESDKPIILEAGGVEAKFRLADAQGAQPDAKDQLERVTARGAVRIVTENGNQELSADEATYDAANEIVEASATTEYGSVTFIDKTKALPTIAKRLRWNLRTDEITILQPMPIIMPTK